MKRYVEGEDRSQAILFPDRLDDYIAEDNPVRVIDVFVDELDLAEVGFEGMEPEPTGRPGRITRWEHEHVLEAMQRRLDRTPHASKLRRRTAEHPFATLKAWMGATHFLTKTLPKVRTEMSLHVLAYNMKRAINLLGPGLYCRRSRRRPIALTAHRDYRGRRPENAVVTQARPGADT
jgi:DDE family transposase